MTTTDTTVAPVVLAADGTPSSEGALRYAVEEARTRGCGLRIVHVNPLAAAGHPLRPVDPSSLSQHARRVLARAAGAARGLAPELALSTTLVNGSRVWGIVKASADARLIVVGRETRHGVERLLTGATTAGVSAHARCPVVTVAADWQPRAEGAEKGHAVVALRRAADAADLLSTAYAWASERGARLTVVHVWELPDAYLDHLEARTRADEWQEQGEEMLDQALDGWRAAHPDIQVETRVVHGHGASVLSSTAEDADVLIVRRAHEHRPFDHLGATVRALLQACPTPVLVVPAHTGLGPASDLVLEESGGLIR